MPSISAFVPRHASSIVWVLSLKVRLTASSGRVLTSSSRVRAGKVVSHGSSVSSTGMRAIMPVDRSVQTSIISSLPARRSTLDSTGRVALGFATLVTRARARARFSFATLVIGVLTALLLSWVWSRIDIRELANAHVSR